jgi:hypothetical protein
MPIRLTRALRVCAALLTAASFNCASANCIITHLASSYSVKEAFGSNNGYTFSNYEPICNKLQKANAQIFIDGGYGAMLERSYGRATIFVVDRNNPRLVITDFSTSMMKMSNVTESAKGKELLWLAINDALNQWTKLDDALSELNGARKKVVQQ